MLHSHGGETRLMFLNHRTYIAFIWRRHMS